MSGNRLRGGKAIGRPLAASQRRRQGIAKPLAAVCAVFVTLLMLSIPAAAQYVEAPPPGFEGATVVEKPGARVPLDLQFNDEEGRPVRLKDFFKDRPVVLVMAYMRCPQLCSLVLNSVIEALAD